MYKDIINDYVYVEKQSYFHNFITLSSNARRVPFEYPHIYLNKKGKACKARVKEWIIDQI